MDDFEEKGDKLMQMAKKIQESGRILPDVRDKEWRKTDAPAARVMNLLVEAEDILIELDSIQMENNQCYPEIENFMLQLGEFRSKYSDFVDQNIDVLEIKFK